MKINMYGDTPSVFCPYINVDQQRQILDKNQKTKQI